MTYGKSFRWRRRRRRQEEGGKGCHTSRRKNTEAQPIILQGGPWFNAGGNTLKTVYPLALISTETILFGLQSFNWLLISVSGGIESRPISPQEIFCDLEKSGKWKVLSNRVLRTIQRPFSSVSDESYPIRFLIRNCLSCCSLRENVPPSLLFVQPWNFLSFFRAHFPTDSKVGEEEDDARRIENVGKGRRSRCCQKWLFTFRSF